jgi:hypothetical protein
MGSSTASETKKRESETKIYDSATKTRDSETNATSIQKPKLRRFRHQLRRDSESKMYDSETKTSETKMLHYKRSTPPPPLNIMYHNHYVEQHTPLWSVLSMTKKTPRCHGNGKKWAKQWPVLGMFWFSIQTFWFPKKPWFPKIIDRFRNPCPCDSETKIYDSATKMCDSEQMGSSTASTYIFTYIYIIYIYFTVYNI